MVSECHFDREVVLFQCVHEGLVHLFFRDVERGDYLDVRKVVAREGRAENAGAVLTFLVELDALDERRGCIPHAHDRNRDFLGRAIRLGDGFVALLNAGNRHAANTEMFHRFVVSVVLQVLEDVLV
ncbi:MAG: hypothetical protein RBG13Loki_4386 [Promethearchaeota archaeon CR_4]|nr:MAG: hypothetical protein RBG13Loki_4386 [Candidatus Lokiarchaeota archaeon CR_4]